jgi:hypothetical protein
MAAAADRSDAQGDPRAEEQPTLEALFECLIAIIQGGDPDRIRVAWDAAERSLVARLETEERTQFAALYGTRPRDVRVLMADHTHLRGGLAQLRATLPLPSADAVRGFVGELRAHNQHERALFERSG